MKTYTITALIEGTIKVNIEAADEDEAIEKFDEMNLWEIDPEVTVLIEDVEEVEEEN